MRCPETSSNVRSSEVLLSDGISRRRNPIQLPEAAIISRCHESDELCRPLHALQHHTRPYWLKHLHELRCKPLHELLVRLVLLLALLLRRYNHCLKILRARHR